MTFYTGDLVRIRKSGSLAVVESCRGGSYSLVRRTCERIAWYDAADLELVERGHYIKLFSTEEIESFERAWKGAVKFL